MLTHLSVWYVKCGGGEGWGALGLALLTPGPRLLPFDEEVIPNTQPLLPQRRKPQRMHREYTPTVTASDQKWPARPFLSYTIGKSSPHGLEPFRKCSWVECPRRWKWFVTITPVFCHIFCLALLLVFKQSNHFLHCLICSDEQNWGTELLPFQPLPSLHLWWGSLTWNSEPPQVSGWILGVHEFPEYTCTCTLLRRKNSGLLKMAYRFCNF